MSFETVRILLQTDPELITNYVNERGFINKIYVLDSEGIVMNTYPNDPLFQDIDLSNLNTINFGSVEPTFSHAVVNNLTGLNEIYVTQEIEDTTVVITYSLIDTMMYSEEVLTMNQHDLKILDQNNTVVYSSNNRNSYHDANIVKTIPVTYNNKEFTIKTVENVYGETRYFYENNIDINNWRIKFSVNESYFESLYRTTNMMIFSVVMLMIIMLLIMIYAFRRHYRQPLLYLNYHFNEVEKRNNTLFNPPITIFKEVQDLNDNYQSMQNEITNREKELSQFTYIASHDLQEPLRMISSYIKIIEMEYFKELDNDGKKYFNYVTDGAKRMKSLIQDLLLYSRSGSEFKMQSVQLDTIIEKNLETLSLSIKESGAKISVSKLPIVNGDPIKLEQLFQNLISNAIKYHKKDLAPTIKITYKKDINTITLTDNGIGIETKYLDAIFEPFKKLHAASEYAGTGIGLAICKRVVDFHNWSIEVSSEEGVGTTFSVKLSK
jgi:signal transduction histidine kinase